MGREQRRGVRGTEDKQNPYCARLSLVCFNFFNVNSFTGVYQVYQKKKKKERNRKCTALNFCTVDTPFYPAPGVTNSSQLSHSGPQLVTMTPAVTMVLTLSACFGNEWTWNHTAGIFCVWLSFVQCSLCGFHPRWYSSLIFHCCVPLSEYAIAYWFYGWWTFGCLVFDSHRQWCLEYSWTFLSYFSSMSLARWFSSGNPPLTSLPRGG